MHAFSMRLSLAGLLLVLAGAALVRYYTLVKRSLIEMSGVAPAAAAVALIASTVLLLVAGGLLMRRGRF